MNKRGHVLNAVFLAVGFGIMVPIPDAGSPVEAMFIIGVPLLLGALLPDIDTAFGTHRRTLHNLGVLIGFYLWPIVYGNLRYVWIGVLAHYVLDLVAGARGMALLYPWSREFDLPYTIPYSGWFTDISVLLITAGELVLIYAILEGHIAVSGVGQHLPRLLG